MSKKKANRKKSDRSERAPSDRKPKLKRAEYEAEMAQLHAELVEVQYSVKHAGMRIVVLFEGRDAAGKAACSNVLSSVSARAPSGSSLCPHRPSGSARRSTSNATWSISRRLERSSCSIGAGTTAQASNA